MASKPITIAVMGATGSGKTSFINLVSGSRLGVGDGLESCTICVETSLPFNLDGRSVALIDTPGFDDTNSSDTDILKTIASFLSSKYEEGTKLAGVIYMHRIMDVKAGGISRRNFSLFRALCGDASLKNVAIVTNFWDQVERDVGERREAELRSKDIFFKPVLDKGASMLRHEGTLQSAHAIMRHFVNNAPWCSRSRTRWSNNRACYGHYGLYNNHYEYYATTSKDIKLQLTNEGAVAAAKGQLHPHDMSPAAFLQVSLELEDLQCTLCLCMFTAKGQMTMYDRKDILDRRTALTCHITAWRSVQDIYMPWVIVMCKVPTFSSGVEDDADDDNADAEPDRIDDMHNAEEVDLILPSSLLASHRSGDYVEKLMFIETRLRLAQADDALGDLRHLRRAKQDVLDFKILNMSGAGNKPNTQVREVFNQVESCIQHIATCYNVAYRALTVLDPDSSWVACLHFLKAEDICGPGREEDKVSEGRHEVSWIWLAPTEVIAQPSDESAESVECFTMSMHIKWAKSHARVKQWEEEVSFIQVEMQRVLATFEKDASIWLDRCQLHDGDEGLMNGLSAYVAKQAAIKIRLANQFMQQWLPGLRAFNLDPPWATKYENMLHLLTLPSFVSPLFSFNKLGAEEDAGDSMHHTHVPELARSLGPTPTTDERIDMFDD
ncbi:hypothetical protein EWM64_g8053 [Hericium alpestre]|uniref:G domain-containing protein n=1 Tax=Hericium alpestre TaxID=135208 RepID=A0A4Y9ZR56_9AGAM|nr:hypothetical protein EWM64_g8053 [Hericium alpestre]